MKEGLVDTAARSEKPDDRRIYGVAIAKVINNIDTTNQGRVQLHLPWLACYEPWARLAGLMSGKDCGTYFIPQVDDEVLVAFNHGDVREPYVVGCLWNGQDKSPGNKTDAKYKRIIRTPKGHEIMFDDAKGEVSVKNSKGQSVILGPDNVEINLDDKKSTTILFEKGGKMTIKASDTITLDAPTITIKASKSVSVQGNQGATINGGSRCSIDGAQISIG
jgi:uncharacterized protein involved in type VI secretion and phage assembly